MVTIILVEQQKWSCDGRMWQSPLEKATNPKQFFPMSPDVLNKDWWQTQMKLQRSYIIVGYNLNMIVAEFLYDTNYVGDYIGMLATTLLKIYLRHFKIVTNINRLQHTSPTSM